MLISVSGALFKDYNQQVFVIKCVKIASEIETFDFF